MRSYGVIIIGAGASGLVAGICAARRGKSVLILEKQEKSGHKIYATGNGKCNLTNMDMDNLDEKYKVVLGDKDENLEFVSNVLNRFSNSDTIEFFKDLGILTYSRNGYVYPNSNQASSVVKLLLEEARSLKINIINSVRVSRVSIEVVGKREVFKVYSDSETYLSEKLCLACGGKASPVYGTEGDGYDFLKSFNHKLSQIYPGLCPLKIKEEKNILKGWSGTRFYGSICIDGKSEVGEFVLTDYGISGIPVFQMSLQCKELLSNKRIMGSLNFLGDLSVTEREICDFLLDEVKNCKEPLLCDASVLLCGFLNEKIIDAIFKKLGIRGIKVDMLNPDLIKQIVSLIFNYPLEIIDFHGFERAQVTCGGAVLSEINCENMSSKIVDNLYVIGELLDVTGICGGYNLQWAFSTGYLAGCNM
ncbi:MAG: aminoacetone oxidase family FAD-binding enzyme [Lachnospiraceae bacterium]|nr:aminoacetone oxidase family FAD-binding enzyme [Lachnospiraceae bacterium]